MPWMCVKRIKYVRNGFTKLKMILEFDNRLKYVTIDLEILGNS